MSKHEGLSRVAKALRGLGVVWMLFCIVGAAIFAWGGERRSLTRDEQIALYERQVGHSIENDLRNLPTATDKDDAFTRFMGGSRVLAAEEQKTQILEKHFGGTKPEMREADWVAAGVFLAAGLIGFGFVWGLGWIVAGFAS